MYPSHSPHGSQMRTFITNPIVLSSRETSSNGFLSLARFPGPVKPHRASALFDSFLVISPLLLWPWPPLCPLPSTKQLFKSIYWFLFRVYEYCVCMLHEHLCMPKGGQKRVSEALKLEFQKVGNHQRVLSTELWSPARVVHTLNQVIVPVAVKLK